MVTLDSIDSVPVYDDNLSDELKIWLTNLADILNYNFGQIQTELMSLDARITALGG